MKTQTFLLESFNELSLVSNQQSQSIFRKDTNWKWTNFQTSPLHFRFNCALLFCYTNITIFISFLKIMTKLLPIFWWTFEPFWVELMIVLIRIFSWRRKCFYFRVCHTQKKCNLNEMLHEKSRWGFLFTHFMGVFVTSLTKVYVLKNRCSSCLQEHHHTCLISFLNTLFPLRVNYIVLNCQKHQVENTR